MSARKDVWVVWCTPSLLFAGSWGSLAVTLCSLLGYTPLLRQACVESDQKSTAVTRSVTSALILRAALCIRAGSHQWLFLKHMIGIPYSCGKCSSAGRLCFVTCIILEGPPVCLTEGCKLWKVRLSVLWACTSFPLRYFETVHKPLFSGVLWTHLKNI